MTAPNLAAKLRELAQAATPGPWTTTVLGPSDEDWPSAIAIAATYGRQKIYANPIGGTYPHADQQFIAAANPQTVLALLDRIELLERLLGEACDLFDEMTEDEPIRPAGQRIAAIRAELGKEQL